MSYTKFTWLIYANMCIRVIWLSMSRRGFWGGLGVFNWSTQLCSYYRMIFQNHKINPYFICDYLHSGGDIYMICNKNNLQKCGWCLSMNVESSWRVGQKFLFLMNGSWKLTCWPTGQPIGQWADLFTKSNPLANRLTCWPRTPICWPTGRPVGQHLLIGGWVITGILSMIPTGVESIIDTNKNTILRFMLEFWSFVLLFAELDITDGTDIKADCLIFFGTKSFPRSTFPLHYRWKWACMCTFLQRSIQQEIQIRGTEA